MAYPSPLKYCLDLPQVNGRCRHWLRSKSTKGVSRHHPESQVRRNSERIGFFILREEWISEVEKKQLQLIPRKTARCYGCRTNFIMTWEKYAHKFNWPSIVDGRYAQTFFNSYDYLLIEEFKLTDEEYNKAMGEATTKKSTNPPPPEESSQATDSEFPGVREEQSPVEERHVKANFAYFLAHSPYYLYTPDGVDSDISLS